METNLPLTSLRRIKMRKQQFLISFLPDTVCILSAAIDHGRKVYA